MAKMGRPLDKIERMILLGFDKKTIETAVCVDPDEWCLKKYGETFSDLMAEIEYAKNPNQDSERPYTVYMHIAPNGKKYIGITKCKLNKRWGNGRGYWTNEHFTSAIKKYGWDSIQHAILYMGLSKEEAEKKEKELIRRFCTTDRKYGYNIEGGGSVKKEVSDSTRIKLRQNAIGVYPSEETRRKMRESHLGEKCHFYGVPLSEDKKQHLRELRSKPIVQMDLENHIVNEYSSMKEAGSAVGVTRQAIRCACIGRTKTCAGYKWRYK